MAKIDRYSGNLESFASQADTNQRTTFGTTDVGDNTLDGNINSFYLTGWQIVGPNEKPTLQDFNAAFFTIGRLMAYVHQMGMPEWNGEQEYHIGSKVNRAGVEYICTTNSHVSVTPPESDAANWRLPAAADIGYDNTSSGLTAETVQEAIDESAGSQLGVNQTWQDLTASRTGGVTYTNTTGRSIAISAWVRTGFTMNLTVSGVVVGRSRTDVFTSGDAVDSTVFAIVPNGASYSLSTTPDTWAELR